MSKWKKAAALFSLVLILAGDLAGAPPRASAGSPPQEDAPLEAPQSGGGIKRVGAYFFDWYMMPGQMDPEQFFAFHPPGVTYGNTEFHTCDPEGRYKFPYTGGTYNTTYYNSAYVPGFNEHPQRWWEWQFRDMAEAGLDFAVLNSWDGADFFYPPQTRIREAGRYLNGALNALGKPLQVAIYDDTTSEVYEWNYDRYGQLPPPQCRPPTGAGCEPYRMPLSNEDNWLYFTAKLDEFYGTVQRDKWATLDGRTVDQGGRPLILMHVGEGYFIDLVVGETRYAARLMCTIKKHMMERFHTPDPFLLPNGTWGLWGGDPGLVQPARCSSVGIFLPGDPFIIDGWSAYGMANGAFCTDPAHPGVCIFPYQTSATYTTAYIGPGNDLATGDPCAYSGPYGGSGPNQRYFYNARWWDLEGNAGGCLHGHCQERYYHQSWQVVQASDPPVDLVVIESWNELAEGTSIGKINTYVAPNLETGGDDPVYFIYNPNWEPPWSPWFWILRTQEMALEWRGNFPPYNPVIVDDARDVPGWERDDGAVGVWRYQCCYHHSRGNVPPASYWWNPSLPESGSYDVYAYWPYVQGATQDARYFIHHAQGSTVVRVDQTRREDAGRWNYLGRYPFRGGFWTAQGVRLSNRESGPQDARILADAVKFVYRGPWAPPRSTRVVLPAIFVGVHRRAPTPPSSPPGEPYPPPEAPGGLPAPLPATPVPLAGLESYPGPTVTPRPSPTPTPSPTPVPPDRLPPHSQVNPLPLFHNQPGIWVTWNFGDEGGSGVGRIDVQMRDGPAGPWQDWLPFAGLFAYFSPAQDGHTYYFRTRATDWAGNVEPWPAGPDYDAVTTVDRTPPSSQVAGLPAYSSASFTVSWSGQDATSGIAAYDVQFCRDDCADPRRPWNDWLIGTTGTSATFGGGEDGHTYSFRSRARDRAGNVEPWPGAPDASTLVDLYPPTSAVDVLPPYSGNPIPVSWSGQDSASGVATYDIQVCRVDCTLPQDAVWTDWLTATKDTRALYEGEDGMAYFRCRARDRAGHQDDYPKMPDASTLIDTLPPSSQVTVLPAYSPASFTVSWSGYDSNSGIVAYDVQFCVGECAGPMDGGSLLWSDWLTATTALSATFSGEDGKTYSFRSRARDRAGNVEPWPAQADASTVVDAVLPTSEVGDLPAYSPASFTVSWTGADGGSGVGDYDIQVCLGECGGPFPIDPWTDWLTGTTALSATFSGGQDGQAYHFRSRARDRAGNVEPWPAQADASTVVDALPPTSQVEALPAYSMAAFAVSWRGQDTVSGIASFDVQVCAGECGASSDPASWTDWLTGTSALSATFSGEDGKTYHFRCRARDLVGHLEDWPPEADASTTVDALPPKSAVNALPPYSPGTFTVTWAGLDMGSGVAGYDIQVCASPLPVAECWRDWITGTPTATASFSGTHGQLYAFRSRARDVAGNQEDYPAEADAWTHVDSRGPQTWMEPPVSQDPGSTFQVRWSGTDEPAGLAYYDLYVRDESVADWTPWLVGVTTTQALFRGTAGHTYYFCVRGVDRVGNVEDKDCPGMLAGWPIAGEAVVSAPPTSRVEGLPEVAPGQRFEVRWSSTPPNLIYDVQVMDLADGLWKDWLVRTPLTSAPFTGEPGHTYAFRCRVLDAGLGPAEPWPWGYDARTTVPTAEESYAPGSDRCAGRPRDRNEPFTLPAPPKRPGAGRPWVF